MYQILNASTLDKLLEIMNGQPQILAHYGLSEEIIRKQVEFTKKYEKIQVDEFFNRQFPSYFWLTFIYFIIQKQNYTSEDKKKLDSDLWSNWLKKYLVRIYTECDKHENYAQQRIDLMNANNPRF